MAAVFLVIAAFSQASGSDGAGASVMENDAAGDVLGQPAGAQEPLEPQDSADGRGGRASVSLSGYMEFKGVCAMDHDSPDEDPSGVLGLELEAKSAPWNSLMVSIRAVQDGKVLDAGEHGAFLDFRRVYQDRTPYISVDEAYVDFYTGRADLRVGIQKFAWGRLDEINPTDNLNPEDLTEAVISDEVDRKIGVPAIKLDCYSEMANVELAFVPFYVPYRLPDSDERWFPGVLKPPKTVYAGPAVGTVPVKTTYADMDVPARTLQNSEAGVRVSRQVGGWDLSVSYFTGYDPMPLTEAVVDLDVSVTDPLSLGYAAGSRVTLAQAVHRVHVFGFDFTTTVSDFTLRGEYAYFHGKRFNRKLEDVLEGLVTRETMEGIYDDFLSEYMASGGTHASQTFRLDVDNTVEMDAMKYGLGVDYIHGDTSLSVQCIQEYVPDHDESRPVYFIKDGFDTLLTVLLKQFFLQNTLELNARAAYDLEFHDYVFRPSVKYNFTDRVQGTLGFVWIGGGERDSMFGQFRHNDEFYARLRCSF
jgi:hypothetical protein